MPYYSSPIRAFSLACLLTCTDAACLLVDADVADKRYKGENVEDNCAIVTPDCSSIGKEGFGQSDLATMAVEYSGSSLTIGGQIFKQVAV